MSAQLVGVMPTAETRTPERSKLRRGFRFALVGLVFGFLGLGVAVYRMSIEAEPPPRPVKKDVAEALSNAIGKAVDKFRGQESAPATPDAGAAWPLSKQLGLAASVGGFISAVMGCISWLAGEHRRWTWAALCVGLAAMAWTHVVVAVSVAVAIVVVLLLLSALG